MINKTGKPRIGYIDLAKGICILLVISYHIDLGDFLYRDDRVSDFFFSFRMPLYYMLSGLFLSVSNGYKDFLQKKVNRLIVPFFFFVLSTDLYYYIKSCMTGCPYVYTSPLYFLCTENTAGDFHNILCGFCPRCSPLMRCMHSHIG